MSKVTHSRDDQETVKFLTESELGALFKAITSKRDTCIFRLAYHRGLRASEVGLLTLEDLDRANQREWSLFVRRLKGGKSGRFALLAVEIASLRAWLRLRGEGPGLLVPSQKRCAITQQQLDRLMKRYATAAGIAPAKAHFHVLRHSCATSMLSRGIALEYIKEHLGHRDIRNTQIYVHITDTTKASVAARLKDWR